MHDNNSSNINGKGLPKHHSVRISEDNLSLEPDERYETLFSYFQDNNIIDCTQDDSYWSVRMVRHAFDYCEDLQQGLDWLGITKSEVPMYFLGGANYFFSLLEAWIPYGWSKFFAQNLNNCSNLTLLHLDDHKDLMPTRLSMTPCHWNDLITNKPARFNNPDSIYSAIHSGAIGIGSILTPLLHCFKHMNILHLKSQMTEYTTGTIAPIVSHDSLVDKNAKILNAEFVETGRINYHLSSCPFELIDKYNDNDPILLHIDMDYFNNRYNGNSEWMAEPRPWDPTEESQREAIDQFVSALTKNQIQDRIIHVAIGVSPSFYPSEYWESGIGHLVSKLCEIGIDLTELRQSLKI